MAITIEIFLKEDPSLSMLLTSMKAKYSVAQGQCGTIHSREQTR